MDWWQTEGLKAGETYVVVDCVGGVIETVSFWEWVARVAHGVPIFGIRHDDKTVVFDRILYHQGYRPFRSIPSI